MPRSSRLTSFDTTSSVERKISIFTFGSLEGREFNAANMRSSEEAALGRGRGGGDHSWHKIHPTVGGGRGSMFPIDKMGKKDERYREVAAAEAKVLEGMGDPGWEDYTHQLLQCSALMIIYGVVID